MSFLIIKSWFVFVSKPNCMSKFTFDDSCLEVITIINHKELSLNLLQLSQSGHSLTIVFIHSNLIKDSHYVIKKIIFSTKSAIPFPGCQFNSFKYL